MSGKLFTIWDDLTKYLEYLRAVGLGVFKGLNRGYLIGCTPKNELIVLYDGTLSSAEVRRKQLNVFDKSDYFVFIEILLQYLLGNIIRSRSRGECRFIDLLVSSNLSKHFKLFRKTSSSSHGICSNWVFIFSWFFSIWPIIYSSSFSEIVSI